MSDRRDYFFRQKVTEDELDQGFATLEAADRALMTDLGKFGIVTGLAVVQHAGVANLTVDVALGSAYDQSGRRIRIPSTQNVDVSVDSNGVSTAVSNANAGGNEKWVSVVAVFDRALSDPREDGNNQPIWFVENESYKFTVVQGAEAASGAATRPALPSNGVLLADVRLTYSQTQVLTANISSSRSQKAVVIAGSPLAISRGRVEEGLGDVVASYNAHVGGTADKHLASMIQYGGGVAWRDGATNPATDVETQLDKILSDLVGNSSGSSGAEKIGAASIVGGTSTLAASTVYAHLSALKSASNIDYAGSGQWADFSSIPASSVEAAIDRVVSDLASQVTPGAQRVGMKLIGNFSAGNVYSAIGQLTQTATGNDGARCVGIAARTNWLSGETNGATEVFTAIDRIITGLSSQTNSTIDGAAKIGFFPSGNIAANTVGGAIRELDTEKAALAGATFTGTPAVAAGIHFGLSSRSITRAAQSFWMNTTSGAMAPFWAPSGYSNLGNGGNSYYTPLLIPNGVTVSSIVTRLGAVTHGGTPASRVTLSFVKFNIVSGGATTIASVNDATAYPALDSAHDLTLSGLTEVIDRTQFTYYAAFSNPPGANTATEQVYNPRVTYTSTAIDDGY